MKNKPKIKSVKANAALNVIYTLTNMLFPLLTFPYVSRILLADGIGQVSFFSSISNYCIMLAGLGLSTYGVRAVARVRTDKEALAKTVQELLHINFLATLAVTAIYILASIFSVRMHSYIALCLINGMLILTAPLSMNWLYSGLEQYDYITKRTIAFKLLSLVAVFTFVHKKEDTIIYALILALSNIGTYLCNALYARRFVDFGYHVQREYRKHIRPMLTLFASSLAINVYTNLDTVMLGFIRGDHEVGLYTTAVKVKTILLNIINAISVVLLPRLSYYISQHREKEFRAAIRQSISVIAFITLPVTMYFIEEAKDCILVLGGDAYMGAVPCMQILMPILIFSGFSNILGNQILIPQGKDSCFMRAVVAGAVLDLVLNAVLMPKYGCVGAAVATFSAEAIQMSIQLHYGWKEIVENIDGKSIGKVVASTAVSGIVLIPVQDFLPAIHPLVRLLVSVTIFFVVYVVSLLLMRHMIVQQIIADVRRMKR